MSDPQAQEPKAPRSRVWDNLEQRTPPRADRAPGARRLMRELYGAGKGGRIDTKTVAADLGVSQRTVQRWMKSGLPPKSAAAQSAVDKHAQWQNSAEGRQRYLKPGEEQKVRSAKKVHFTGKIVVSGDDNRTRHIDLLLDKANLDDVLEAMLAGDDQGAHDALEDLFAEEFQGSVSLDIHHLGFS